MSQIYEQQVERSWVLPALNVLAPARVLYRLTAILAWVLLCYFAHLSAMPLYLVHRSYARRMRRAISRLWLRDMPALLGLRIKVRGTPPSHPYFLVNNHISWLDFLTMNRLCDARCVAMAEMGTIPILRTLIGALDPIYVSRVKGDTTRVIDIMTQALEDGQSLQMAPEGTVTPGRTVKRFHAALLESAVRAKRPVHYASLTYRTPDGYPPASERVLFGPDPYYRETISDEERVLWGEQRTFIGHLVRLLALPWYEIRVRFASEPIAAPDRIELANQLRQAVQHIFEPIE